MRLDIYVQTLIFHPICKTNDSVSSLVRRLHLSDNVRILGVHRIL